METNVMTDKKERKPMSAEHKAKIAAAHRHQVGHLAHGKRQVDMVDDIGLHPRGRRVVARHGRQRQGCRADANTVHISSISSWPFR